MVFRHKPIANKNNLLRKQGIEQHLSSKKLSSTVQHFRTCRFTIKIIQTKRFTVIISSQTASIFPNIAAKVDDAMSLTTIVFHTNRIN